MIALLAYIGIILFFLRLMRLLHDRDRDAFKQGDEIPAPEQKSKGFLSFLDQVRSRA